MCLPLDDLDPHLVWAERLQQLDGDPSEAALRERHAILDAMFDTQPRSNAGRRALLATLLKEHGIDDIDRTSWRYRGSMTLLASLKDEPARSIVTFSKSGRLYA